MTKNRRRGVRRGLMVGLLLLAHSFFVAPAEVGATPVVPAMCPFKERVASAPTRVSCGLLSVPENREAQGTRQIRLLVVRIAASEAARRRADPVIYLTGGPGIHASFYLQPLLEHGAGRNRDIYLLEQRGVGGSDFCPYWGRTGGPARRERTQAEVFDNEIADVRDCVVSAQAAGVDLTGYSTIESARDVRALREALGLQHWNVWGISYGVMLAQAALKTDPAGVRAIVLDGVTPLDMRGTALRGWWFKRLLARYRRACSTQPACRVGFPDFEAKLLAAARALHQRPMLVAVDDRAETPDGLRSYRGDSVPLLPFLLSYDRRYHPAAPAAMAGAARMALDRDAERFRALAKAPALVDLDSSPGLSAVLACRDGFLDRSADMVRRDMQLAPDWAPLLGSVPQLERHRRLCRELGLTSRPADEYRLPVSDVPALVAAGGWDPVTPPPLAMAVLPGLRRAQYLSFPNSGHGPTRTVTCAGDLLTAFLDRPLRPVPNGCAAAGDSPARFVPPLFATRAAPRMLLMWTEQRPMAIAIAMLVAGVVIWSAGVLLAAIRHWMGRKAGRRAADRLLVAAALASLGFVGGVAAAVAETLETARPLLLFGLPGWTRGPAFLAPLLAGMAIALLWPAARRIRAGDTFRAQAARAVSGVAALSLAAVARTLDLWP